MNLPPGLTYKDIIDILWKIAGIMVSATGLLFGTAVAIIKYLWNKKEQSDREREILKSESQKILMEGITTNISIIAANTKETNTKLESLREEMIERDGLTKNAITVMKAELDNTNRRIDQTDLKVIGLHNEIKGFIKDRIKGE